MKIEFVFDGQIIPFEKVKVGFFLRPIRWIVKKRIEKVVAHALLDVSIPPNSTFEITLLLRLKVPEKDKGTDKQSKSEVNLPYLLVYNTRVER